MFPRSGSTLFGDGPIGQILLLLLTISILTSASASTQTTILPTARTSLSMAVYKAIPERFARIHPRFLTPTWSTIAMGIVSIAFYAADLRQQQPPGRRDRLVGLMIAFYYGLTGFACVWFYRKTMWAKPRDVVMQGVLPLLGGIMLLAAFFIACKLYADPDWGATPASGGIGGVFLIGIGSLLLGVILMEIYARISPSYFQGETLPMRHSAELLLVPADGSVARFGLPDSGEMPTVIAPDLSNLPPGRAAVDPLTGETRRNPNDSGAGD